MTPRFSSPQAPFAALKRFATRRHPGERCELCGQGLAKGHRHLLEASTRRLVCSCEGCAVLLGGEGDRPYRAIPRAIVPLPDFRLSPAQWDALRVPIQLAYFTRSEGDSQITAHFPGPGGPIRSGVDPRDWLGLEQENPRLGTIAPEVQALLVNRMRHATEAYVVPIDAALRLSGLIRAHWRGLSGGVDVWREILGFFDELKAGRPHG